MNEPNNGYGREPVDISSGENQTIRSVTTVPLRFAFSGTGSEYFRIWIVNSFLTVVTLGIYSAWAKVRTLQYFYRNTRLDSATFDYHGSPKAILKGRTIIFVVALLFEFSGRFSGYVALGALLLLAAVFPLLLVRSLRFRMANSSYRGLRFAFAGSDRQGYRVFLLWPLLTLLSFFTLAPLAHHRLKRFQHDETRFGTARFGFHGGAGAFYGVYLRTFGMVVVVIGAAMLAQFVFGGMLEAAGTAGTVISIALGVGTFYLALLAVRPFFNARMQNLVWNQTTLGSHRFRSEVKASRLFFIFVTNLVAIVLTLGLFLPFARIRTLRYRIESMTVLAAGPIDAFVAGELDQASALGDAAADWYDVDIAL